MIEKVKCYKCKHLSKHNYCTHFKLSLIRMGEQTKNCPSFEAKGAE